MGKTGRILVALASISTIAAAETRWIRMPAAKFDVYSSASESDTRRTLQYFERVSAFFTEAWGAQASASEPLRVVVFGNRKDYEPYRPNQVAAAFYTQSEGFDYIVLGGLTDDVFPIAVHEYAHLMVNHAGLHFPPWLDEGLAELYSTVRSAGNEVIFGEPVRGRLEALARGKWVPLSAIVAADHDSPYYNEKNQAGSLYSEGWALTHMLALSPAYSPKFPALWKSVNAGTPSQRAIEQVYGKPLDAVEKDLQTYIRKGTFRTGSVAIKMLNPTDRTAAEPLSDFDVRLALLDLASRPGREPETEPGFRELAKQAPARPEPWIALGYLAWRTDRQSEAVEDFAKAIDLGSRNPKLLYDYGRLARPTDPAGAVRALEMALQSQPDNRDARIALAEAQLSAGDSRSAIATLAPVRSVSAAQAPRLFRVSAYAQISAGDRAKARIAAQRWKDSSKDSEERARAEEMLAYLEALDRSYSSFAPARRLGLREPDQNTGPPAAGSAGRLQSFAGSLIEMQCGRDESRLLVKSGEEQAAFLMEDPAKVVASGIRGRPAVDLTCGAQKPVAVVIRFDAAPASRADVRGSVRAIEFHGEPEPAAAPAKPGRPSVAGRFIDFDCISPVPRLILQTERGRAALLLDQPDKLLAYGLPEGKGIDLICGPQKRANVWIEYDPLGPKQHGARGLARAIHYEPQPGKSSSSQN